MIKKFIFLLVIFIILVAFLGGIFSVTFSPFSITVQKPEKDFLIKVVRKVEGLVYRESTIHNPPGDMIPDRIDDKIKQEIKDRIN